MAKPGCQGNSLGVKNETELDKKLSAITSEDEMNSLLHATADFNDRMKIRTAIRDLKKKKLAEAEAAKVAARKSKTTKGAPAPKKEIHLEGIEDEAVLRQMLEDTDDADQKKQIKAHIRDMRQKAREVAEVVITKEDDDYKKQHYLNEEDIPAVSVETVDFPKDKSGVVDFTRIDDIPALEKMLFATDDFGERTQIRSHLKELHERADLEVPDYPMARRLSEGLEANIFQSEKERRRSSLIDRAALEELTLKRDKTENISYDEIDDPDELESMLEHATDIGEKRMIRGALQALRKKLEGGGAQGSSDLSRHKPDRKISFDEEPSKRNADVEAKRTPRFEDRFKKTDASSSGIRSPLITEKCETPRKRDANKSSERFETVDGLEKKRDCLSGKSTTETDNKENNVTPSRKTSLESGKPKRDEVKLCTSSTLTTFPPKEKNNNDITIKPASKRSTSTPLDSGKSYHDTSKLSTPSTLDKTQKENEKNKKELALGARLSKFSTPASDAADARRRDRVAAATSSAAKPDKNGRDAKDSILLSSRLSKFSTPPPETTKSRYSGVPTLSGSKLDSLKSRLSAAATESPRHAETKLKDRALKGTKGKVSEAASKFGGSCSGSSCSSTPCQSPIGSAPSSPKRGPVASRANYGSPAVRRTVEFGKIHNPSLARTPQATPTSDASSAKTKCGDKPAAPLPSHNVPSPKPAPSRSDTAASKTTAPSSTLAAKKDPKSTTIEVPLGKGFSLELQTSSDKTITVKPSSRYHSNYAATSSHAEPKLRDRVGLLSPAERTEQPGRLPPTERREERKRRGAEDEKRATPDNMPPVDDIEDEEALEKMLEAASDFDERKKIRAKLREIRKKRRDEEDKRVADQQKASQDDILRYREETKARGLKAYDKTTPVGKETTTTVSKTPLNNNTIIAPPSSTSPSVQTTSTTVEDLDGKSKTMTTKSVIEGPGSKTVISTTLSKSEDKGTKTQSMKQETMSVKKEESSTGSSFSAKSSSVSSSITTSSSTGAPPTKKLTKFEMEMEEKKKQRELKRADEEKNWKEYMAKKKQDEQQKKQQAADAAQKKKDALMNKFGGKADSETGGFGKGTGMAAVPNASTIKQKLLEWCQRCARGYPEVQITNFSSCWADGMAFCAVIHYHFPNAFDFDVLDKKNRRKNLDLAFDSAEKHADIMPLLETDDMIMMKNKPDWKCVFTYVQSLYRHLSKLKK